MWGARLGPTPLTAVLRGLLRFCLCVCHRHVLPGSWGGGASVSPSPVPGSQGWSRDRSLSPLEAQKRKCRFNSNPVAEAREHTSDSCTRRVQPLRDAQRAKGRMGRGVMQTRREPEVSAARRTFTWRFPRGLARAAAEVRRHGKTCSLWQEADKRIHWERRRALNTYCVTGIISSDLHNSEAQKLPSLLLRETERLRNVPGVTQPGRRRAGFKPRLPSDRACPLG